MDGALNFLNELESVMDQRCQKGSHDSYVYRSMTGHLDRLLKKIGEEAGEVIIAAKNNDPHELVNESADLLFHLMMVLKKQGVSIHDVVRILVQRNQS